MVSTTGWNAINSISGALVLNAVSDGKCPTWAGVVIICVTVWLICILGITWIHHLDSFIWIPMLVVWCVAAGAGAKHFTAADVKQFDTYKDHAAAILSYMAIIFSFSVSWVNCAADYNVRMPLNTPRWQIFGATYLGVFVPSVLVQSLGAALYTGTLTGAGWKLAYGESGVGGLLKMALEPAGGFGKFLMVLGALSSVPVCSFSLRSNIYNLVNEANTERTISQTTIHSLSTHRTLVPGPSASHELFSLPLGSSQLL